VLHESNLADFAAVVITTVTAAIAVIGTAPQTVKCIAIIGVRAAAPGVVDTRRRRFRRVRSVG
jgi:hypothetical protein